MRVGLGKVKLEIWEDEHEINIWIVYDYPGGLLLATATDITEARRFVALWNAAEDRRWTTEDIEAGIITPDVEMRRIVGRLSDQYKNLSKHYSQRGETIAQLEAEKREMFSRLTVLEIQRGNLLRALDIVRSRMKVAGGHVEGYLRVEDFETIDSIVRKARGEE